VDEVWHRLSGDPRPFHQIVLAAKRRVLSTILVSEFTVLARLLDRIAAGHYMTRDYAADRLALALRLFILHFPVYRTYLTASGPSREDRPIIDGAIMKARAEGVGSDGSILAVPPHA